MQRWGVAAGHTWPSQSRSEREDVLRVRGMLVKVAFQFPVSCAVRFWIVTVFVIPTVVLLSCASLNA